MREEKRDAGDVHQWRVNALCVVTNDEDWVDWSISRQPVTAYCVAHYYGDHIHRTARDDGISPQNLRVIASEVSDKLDIPQCSNHCVLRFCLRLWHMIKCDFSNFVDYTTFDYRLWFCQLLRRMKAPRENVVPSRKLNKIDPELSSSYCRTQLGSVG